MSQRVSVYPTSPCAAGELVVIRADVRVCIAEEQKNRRSECRDERSTLEMRQNE